MGMHEVVQVRGQQGGAGKERNEMGSELSEGGWSWRKTALRVRVSKPGCTASPSTHIS